MARSHPLRIPSLISLISEGIIGALIDLVSSVLAVGSDLFQTDVVSQLIDPSLPPLLPQTYDAVLSRVIAGVQERWSDEAGIAITGGRISQIPLITQRSPVASERLGRIIYEVNVHFIFGNGTDQWIKTFVDSENPLTPEQIRAQAIMMAQSRLKNLEHSVQVGVNSGTVDLEVFIQKVSRNR